MRLISPFIQSRIWIKSMKVLGTRYSTIFNNIQKYNFFQSNRIFIYLVKSPYKKDQRMFFQYLYNIVFWSVKPVLYKFSINSISIIPSILLYNFQFFINTSNVFQLLILNKFYFNYSKYSFCTTFSSQYK